MEAEASAEEFSVWEKNLKTLVELVEIERHRLVESVEKHRLCSEQGQETEWMALEPVA